MSNFAEKELEKTIAQDNKKVEEIKDILLLSESTDQKNVEFLRRIGFDNGLKVANRVKAELDAKKFYLDKGFKIINQKEFVDFIETLRIHSNIEITKVQHFKGKIKIEDIEKLQSLDEIEDIKGLNLYVIYPKNGNHINQDAYILFYINAPRNGTSYADFLDRDNKYIIPVITKNSLNYSRFKISKFYMFTVPFMLLMAIILTSPVLYFLLTIIFICYVLGYVISYNQESPKNWNNLRMVCEYYENTKLLK